MAPIEVDRHWLHLAVIFTACELGRMQNEADSEALVETRKILAALDSGRAIVVKETTLTGTRAES